MHRIEMFKKLIKSNLSNEEVVKKIMLILSEDRKEFYYGDNSLGYHSGFIDENEYIPVTNNYMKNILINIDKKEIYLEAVKGIKMKLSEGEIYELAAIFTINNLIHKYFYGEKTNKEEKDLFDKYLEKRINTLKRKFGPDYPYYDEALKLVRIKYMFEKGIETETNVIYNISSSQGLGNGAHCIEKNTLCNNLLSFFGFHSININ